MILRVATRIAADDHLITGPQRVSGHFASELDGGTPLHHVPRGRAVRLLDHDVHEGVWAAQQELNEPSFDRDFLIFQIRRRETSDAPTPVR